MEKISFVYKKKGCMISDASWIEKLGQCNLENDDCDMAVKKQEEMRCNSNLVGHCCKHVVNGSSHEKELFLKAVGKEDAILPRNIRSKNDEIVKQYEKLSESVLQEPASVFLSGDGKYVRIVCEGSGKNGGIVDYLGYGKRASGGSWRVEEYPELGIVSSFFNLNCGDAYVIFRLAHQRYYEHLAKGKNVSTVLLHKGWSSIAENEKISIPLIDQAFDQAALSYYSCPDGNYSAGTLYHYFYNRYNSDLDIMYGEMTEYIDADSKPNKQIWNTEKEQATNIRKIMNRYENVYTARNMMEYLIMIYGPGFTPDLNYGIDHLIKLSDYVSSSNPDKHVTEKACKQYEMILQKKHLERVCDSMKAHYSEDAIKSIGDFIAENEREYSEVGGVADHAAFSAAYSLVGFFVSVYVFWRACKEIYRDGICQYKFIQEIIDEWFRTYDRFNVLNGKKLFAEWLDIFDDILQFRSHMIELCE